jgi:hypothetical protein
MKKILFYSIALTLFLFQKQIVIAQSTLILQPGSTDGKDAFLQSYQPNINNGGSSEFNALAWTIGGTPVIERGLIDFDLSTIPIGAVIQSATLILYNNPNSTNGFQNGQHYHGTGSNQSYLQRVTSAWNENTVTWNTQPAITTINQVILPQDTSAHQDYVVNATALVQDIVNNPTTSFGFLLRLTQEQQYRCLLFASSDHSNAALHPKLIVVYSSTGGPSITTGSVPSQICVQAQFNLTYSTSGAFNSGNVFTAQLSDASGSFNNPTVIGSVASTTGGSIACTISSSQPTGTGYRVRVVSSNPVIIGSDNGSNFTINTGIGNAGNVNGPNWVCPSSMAQVTYSYYIAPVSGATSYNWTVPFGCWIMNGQGTSGIQVSFSSAAVSGNISVTPSNSSGCQGQPSSINVTVNPIPQDQFINGGGTYCAGNNGVPVGIGGSQTGAYYQLKCNSVNIGSPVSGTGAALSFGNQTQPGTYTVNGYFLTGCNRDMTNSTTVSVNPTPNVAVSTVSSSCSSSNGSAIAVASGSTAPYTYLWSTTPAQNSATATNLAAGSYTVTVTDANGCSRMGLATVSANSTLVSSASAINHVTCNGGSNGSASASASNGTAPYTYQWIPSGGNSSTAVNLAAGSYTVLVTDANGCTSSNMVSITQPPALAATISILNGVDCNGGSNGVAAVSVSNGTAPFTYQWTPSGGNGATASNLSAGVYTVLVTDANGCSTSSSANVPQSSTLAASASALNNVSCNGGNNGAATTAVSGGTSPYTFQWSPSGGNGVTANNLSAGTYTVLITDANGCTSSAFATITQPSAIAATPYVLNNVSCNSGTNGRAVASVSGGTSPYTFQWSPSGGNTATANNLSAGTYTAFITDANGCTSSSSATITQPSALTASASPLNNVWCNGGSNGRAVANASGGTPPYTFQWSPSGGNTATANNLSAGAYTVLIIDANGCNSSSSATITQPPSLSSSVAVTNSGCSQSNGAIDLTVSGGTPGYTYLWSNGATTQDISGLSPGNYTVTVTDSYSCFIIQTATVISSGTLPATPGPISGRDLICRNSQQTYSVAAVTGATSYTWTVPTGATILGGQGGRVINVQFSNNQASGNICVYATNSCGNGPVTCKALTVITSRPSPPTSISGPSVGCPNTSATYTCPLVANADVYNWTLPANASYGMGNSTNTMIVNFNSSFTGGTLKVSAGNCVGYSSNVSLAITSTPGTPGNISGPNQACTNQTVAYSINAVSGATTYQWTAPAGSIIASGQGTTSVTVTFGTSSGTLSVRAGNACGYGNPKNKSITVNCTQRPELSTDAEAQHATLYPNPATENVTVTFNTSQASQYTIRLIDMTGRIIFSEKGKSAEGINQLEFAVADYAKGVYCFILENNDERIMTERLIVE